MIPSTSLQNIWPKVFTDRSTQQLVLFGEYCFRFKRRVNVVLSLFYLTFLVLTVIEVLVIVTFYCFFAEGRGFRVPRSC